MFTTATNQELENELNELIREKYQIQRRIDEINREFQHRQPPVSYRGLADQSTKVILTNVKH